MNQGSIGNLLGQGIKKLVKQENEKILARMKDAKTESEKLDLWSQHVAQKMLDERPENKFKMKLSELFKGKICKNWVDDLTKEEMDKQAAEDAKQFEETKKKNA